MTTPTPPPPLASLTDYTALYGAVDAALEPRVEAALRVASAAVRGAAGYTYVDDETGELTTVPEGVWAQTLSTARRLISNPDLLKSETAGPFSRTLGDTVGALLDRDERREVRRAAGRHGLGQIRVGRTPIETLLGISTTDLTVLEGSYESDPA
jgi:hypothetical protein